MKPSLVQRGLAPAKRQWTSGAHTPQLRSSRCDFKPWHSRRGRTHRVEGTGPLSAKSIDNQIELRSRGAFPAPLALPTCPTCFACPANLISISLSISLFLCPRKRHRGDLNPCGQSPMDFESISLATRTQCHVPSPLPLRDRRQQTAPPSHVCGVTHMVDTRDSGWVWPLGPVAHAATALTAKRKQLGVGFRSWATCPPKDAER